MRKGSFQFDVATEMATDHFFQGFLVFRHGRFWEGDCREAED